MELAKEIVSVTVFPPSIAYLAQFDNFDSPVDFANAAVYRELIALRLQFRYLKRLSLQFKSVFSDSLFSLCETNELWELGLYILIIRAVEFELITRIGAIPNSSYNNNSESDSKIEPDLEKRVKEELDQIDDEALLFSAIQGWLKQGVVVKQIPPDTILGWAIGIRVPEQFIQSCSAELALSGLAVVSDRHNAYAFIPLGLLHRFFYSSPTTSPSPLVKAVVLRLDPAHPRYNSSVSQSNQMTLLHRVYQAITWSQTFHFSMHALCSTQLIPNESALQSIQPLIVSTLQYDALFELNAHLLRTLPDLPSFVSNSNFAIDNAYLDPELERQTANLFQHLRQLQQYALNYLTEHFSQDRFEYVNLQMGTGSGKSTVAVQLSNWLTIHAKFQHTVILSRTIFQADQYANTIRQPFNENIEGELWVLAGKAKMCIHPKQPGCSLHFKKECPYNSGETKIISPNQTVEEMCNQGLKNSTCPYYAVRDSFTFIEKQDIISASYAMATTFGKHLFGFGTVNNSNEIFNNGKVKRLIVIDESHNIPQLVHSTLSFTWTTTMFTNPSVEKKYYEPLLEKAEVLLQKAIVATNQDKTRVYFSSIETALVKQWQQVVEQFIYVGNYMNAKGKAYPVAEWALLLNSNWKWAVLRMKTFKKGNDSEEVEVVINSLDGQAWIDALPQHSHLLFMSGTMDQMVLPMMLNNWNIEANYSKKHMSVIDMSVDNKKQAEWNETLIGMSERVRLVIQNIWGDEINSTVAVEWKAWEDEMLPETANHLQRVLNLNWSSLCKAVGHSKMGMMIVLNSYNLMQRFRSQLMPNFIIGKKVVRVKDLQKKVTLSKRNVLVIWEDEDVRGKMKLSQLLELLTRCHSANCGVWVFANAWGSIVEGLDLPGGLLRHGVLVGIPWMSPYQPFNEDVTRFMGNQQLSNAWKRRQGLVMLNQSMGRVFRGGNDWGSILLLTNMLDELQDKANEDILSDCRRMFGVWGVNMKWGNVADFENWWKERSDEDMELEEQRKKQASIVKEEVNELNEFNEVVGDGSGIGVDDGAYDNEMGESVAINFNERGQEGEEEEASEESQGLGLSANQFNQNLYNN